MPFEAIFTCATVLIHNGFTKIPPILSLLFVIKIIEALGIFLLEMGKRETKTF